MIALRRNNPDQVRRVQRRFCEFSFWLFCSDCRVTTDYADYRKFTGAPVSAPYCGAPRQDAIANSIARVAVAVQAVNVNAVKMQRLSTKSIAGA